MLTRSRALTHASESASFGQFPRGQSFLVFVPVAFVVAVDRLSGGASGATVSEMRVCHPRDKL